MKTIRTEKEQHNKNSASTHYKANTKVKRQK